MAIAFIGIHLHCLRVQQSQCSRCKEQDHFQHIKPSAVSFELHGSVSESDETIIISHSSSD